MQDSSDKSKSRQAASQVDVESIRELVNLMGQNDLVELEYETGELAIRLSKRPPAAAAVVQAVQAATPVAMPAAPSAATPAAAPAAAEADKLKPIASPMVGTFYAASGPDAGPFVSVGSQVGEDTVVCLIEAMKVFNEIKAGVNGRIAKVCVSNEATVEFGQALFLVDPS
jgi:acetyl-CoA carboxylase biotin carboxyl carrier protein